MHTYEIISIPGRNTGTIIKIYIGGEEGDNKQFLYMPSPHKGPPPWSIPGVLKSLSIRRPIYKPNDILVCEQSKALRNVVEKRKSQDRVELILLSIKLT